MNFILLIPWLFSILTTNVYANVDNAKLDTLLTAHEAAVSNGIDPKVLIKILQCESGLEQSARGKAGEIGISQFMPKTFLAFEKEYGKDLDIYKADDQIELMAWAFKTGKKSHWTCARLVK